MSAWSFSSYDLTNEDRQRGYVEIDGYRIMVRDGTRRLEFDFTLVEENSVKPRAPAGAR